MRLNKFLSHAGMGTRRKAESLVKSGKVAVNGMVELNPGKQVSEDDIVFCNGKRVVPGVQHFTYLLNKPKNLQLSKAQPTSSSARSLADIFDAKITEIGRFPEEVPERMAGLMIWTNDEKLISHLNDPGTEVTSVFLLHLERAVDANQLDEIEKTLTSGKGPSKWKSINLPLGQNQSVLEVEWCGKSPAIIFEDFKSLGFEIKTADRTYYAGLTKKALGRGHYRELSKEEKIRLSHYRFL